jgi:hypothetical protein
MPSACIVSDISSDIASTQRKLVRHATRRAHSKQGRSAVMACSGAGRWSIDTVQLLCHSVDSKELPELMGSLARQVLLAY